MLRPYLLNPKNTGLGPFLHFAPCKAVGVGFTEAMFRACRVWLLKALNSKLSSALEPEILKP